MTLDQEALKKCELKYFTKPEDLKHLVVLDPERVHQRPFWRNDVVRAWCLSGSAGSDQDFEFGCESSYWLGIYDDGRVDFHMDTYGGMCSYHPEYFLDADSISNQNDRDVQIAVINAVNQLIDDGVLDIPEKTEEKQPEKIQLQTYSILRTDRSGKKQIYSGYTSEKDAYLDAEFMARKDAEERAEQNTVWHSCQTDMSPQEGKIALRYGDGSCGMYEVIPNAVLKTKEREEKDEC